MADKSEILQEAFSKHQKGQLTDARDLYLKILEKDSQNAQVWDLLGVLYYQAKDYEQAEICIKKAIEFSPRIYYLENLARLYLEKEDYPKAKSLYEDLAKYNPTYENWFNLAMSYKALHLWQEAKEAYHKSLEINPKGYESYFNLAYLALNDNDPNLAAECYKKALEIKPDDWESVYFLSLVYMQLKNYEKGLELFESRLCRQSAIVSQEKIYPNIMKSRPEWKGENLSGKTLFTYYEAGFGDMLMLYRYVPILTKMCKKLIIKPQKELAKLFRENSYGAEIIENYNYKKEIDFDYHIPFLSIPYILGYKGEEIFVHHNDSYLAANPETISYYKENFCKNNKFKIGIKWQGNTHYDLERVIKVEDFFKLFEIPNTQFYSFQTFEGSEKLEQIKSKYDVIDLGATFENFSDTAGAIENMDLIISNDSSLVHLAGAMKKNCFVLLPYIYNWRWHTDLTKCDWYDSVKIFRQKEFGKWNTVFDEVKIELNKLIIL
ncbi:tetratricopeptide repeat protein [bacterium]|nr:tetratricopeptide repeat protein [bacterium]